jgi:hypothetical protein
VFGVGILDESGFNLVYISGSRKAEMTHYGRQREEIFYVLKEIKTVFRIRIHSFWVQHKMLNTISDPGF